MYRSIVFFFALQSMALIADLSLEEVADLGKRQGDEKELSAPLKKLSPPGAYDVRMVYQKKGTDDEVLEIRTVAKAMDGTKLVVTTRFPGHDADATMVIVYDEEAGVYRKTIGGPSGLAVMEGVSPEGSRAITWRTVKPLKGDRREMVLSIEHHTDTGGTWVEVFAEDGEESYRVVGSSKRRDP